MLDSAKNIFLLRIGKRDMILKQKQVDPISIMNMVQVFPLLKLMF